MADFAVNHKEQINIISSYRARFNGRKNDGNNCDNSFFTLYNIFYHSSTKCDEM